MNSEAITTISKKWSFWAKEESTCIQYFGAYGIVIVSSAIFGFVLSLQTIQRFYIKGPLNCV